MNGTSSPITLTIATATGITGNYAFAVLGTSLGYPSHQGTSSLSVQDFSLSISPSLLTIPSRGSGTFTITATPINGFTGTIPLTRIWVNSTPYIADAWNPSDSVTAGGQVQYTVTDEGSAPNGTFALQIGGDNRYADADLHIGSSITSPSVSCSGSPTQPAIGQTVTFTATPSGGAPPYTYSWSGVVSGNGQSASFTPTTLSGLSASVTVTDSNYLSATGSCSVNSGPGGNALTILTSSTLPYGTAGAAYSQTLAASGGTGSYTWSALSTLPTGLTVSSSGVLSGTPSTAGNYTFYIKVADTGGHSVSSEFALTIAAGGAQSSVQVSLAYPQLSGGSPGGTHQFTFHYTDPLGPSDISGGQIAFNADTTSPELPVCQLDWNVAGNLNITSLEYGTFGSGTLSSTYCTVYASQSTLVQTAQGYDVSAVLSFPQPLPNTILPAWTRGTTRSGATADYIPTGAHVVPHVADNPCSDDEACDDNPPDDPIDPVLPGPPPTGQEPLCGGRIHFGAQLSRYSDGTLAATLTAFTTPVGNGGAGWLNEIEDGSLWSASKGFVTDSGGAMATSMDTDIAVLPFNSGSGYTSDYAGNIFQVVGDFYFSHPEPHCDVILNYGFPGYTDENGDGNIEGYTRTFNLSGDKVDPTPVIYSVDLNPPLLAGGTSVATIEGRDFGISTPTVTLACSSGNTSAPCTSSDVTAVVNGACTPGSMSSCITATLTAATTASGDYDVTLTSNGTPTYGNQFQSAPGTQAQSNPGGPITVSCPAYVVIGSRPISISPGNTPGTYTATLTSTASPPGGIYTWSTNNPSMVGFSQSTPSTGPSANLVTLVIISTNGTATITLTYLSPCGAAASNSFTFALTNDTTVVAWINAGPIEPGTGQLSPSDPVYQDLVNNPGQCAALLAGWASSGQMGYGQANNGLTAQEIQFAIQFLNAGSGNNQPPGNPNTTAYVNGQNYRLYQRFQAYYELANGAINPATVGYLQNTALNGVTPEPCTGFQILSVASQPNSRNGEFGLTSDGSLVYQLTEARIGNDGQQVNQFLDGPVGGNWTNATPWIWSTVQFDANGYTRSWVQGANLQIFPAYQVFTNSSAYPPGTFPESLANLTSFVALNSTSQYTGPSK